jgi:2-isopropylmalate synthase
MDAEAIGLSESKLILGKHSGRHAFEKRLNELGFDLTKEDLDKAFVRFKALADKKKEIFDQDLESIVADEVYSADEMYHLQYMTVMTSLDGVPTAAIRIRSGEEILQEAMAGVGSVDAVYQTIAKMIPVKHHLIDYSVKSVTGGTDALGEVTVKLGDTASNIFTGRGSSLDIIEASAKAYIQAVNKLVSYHTKRDGLDKAKRPQANL